MFIDSLKFVSIADEKVARVFEAPQSFVDSAEKLGVAKFSAEEVRGTYVDVRGINITIPLAYSSGGSKCSTPRPFEQGYCGFRFDFFYTLFPSLLSPYEIVSEGSVVTASRRPFEGELAAITLWPEVEKVFGHGYEVFMHT